MRVRYEQAKRVEPQRREKRLSNIERACPGVGREWIRSLLSDLKADGKVPCRGKGPGARWRHMENKGINP